MTWILHKPNVTQKRDCSAALDSFLSLQQLTYPSPG